MQKHLWTAFSCPNTRIDLFRPSTVSGVMLIFNLPFSRIPRILMPNFLRMSNCAMGFPFHSCGISNSKIAYSLSSSKYSKILSEEQRIAVHAATAFQGRPLHLLPLRSRNFSCIPRDARAITFLAPNSFSR